MTATARAEGPSLERTALASGAVLLTISGSVPGPTLGLLGGVHGDEDEGVLAVRRIVLESLNSPLRGTIRAVAPAHPASWAARSRTSPLDNANLARVFPGDPAGSPTEQLAHDLTEQVIRGADFLIDLHSAGVAYSSPLLCGYTRVAGLEEVSARAAQAFAAPLIWAHPDDEVPGRSLSAARDLGIPAIYAECTGGGGITAQDVDTYVGGTLSVMADLDMLPGSYRSSSGRDARIVYGDGNFDGGQEAPSDGLFVSTASAGAIVGPGDEIGRVYHYDGHLLTRVVSAREGMVIFLRRKARILAGEVIFVLADLTGGDS